MLEASTIMLDAITIVLEALMAVLGAVGKAFEAFWYKLERSVEVPGGLGK